MDPRVRRLIALFLWMTTAIPGWTAPYVDPNQFQATPWGALSHWLQPWRAYLETLPASVFIQGVGMHLDFGTVQPPPNWDLIMQMLGSHGVRHVRIEIGWGSLDYQNESIIKNASQLATIIRAAKAHG